jgi:hypothetical protein
MRSWRAPVVVLFVAIAMLGLTACGSSSSSSPHDGAQSASTTTGVPPNVLTSKQIADSPAGSAARILLEFWQAVQFSDVLTAQRFVSSEAVASITPARFTSMIQTLGDRIPGLRIISTTRVGTDAVVRVYLLFYTSSGTISASSPQSFTLRDGRLGYQLHDLSYFLKTERTVLAAQRKSR